VSISWLGGINVAAWCWMKTKTRHGTLRILANQLIPFYIWSSHLFKKEVYLNLDLIYHLKWYSQNCFCENVPLSDEVLLFAVSEVSLRNYIIDFNATVVDLLAITCASMCGFVTLLTAPISTVRVEHERMCRDESNRYNISQRKS
jgi:hypothetical protein